LFAVGTGLYECEIKGAPELAIQLTSLVALSGSLTGAGASRGALYVSFSQQARPIFGLVPGTTLLVVHGVLAESNSKHFSGKIAWVVPL
jgi:hypothetical protein